MAEQEKYICSISVHNKNRKMILAGTPFAESDLKAPAFKSLMDGGYLRLQDDPAPAKPAARSLITRPEVTGTKAKETGPRSLVVGPTVDDLGVKVKPRGKKAKAPADGIFVNDPTDLEVYSFEVLMSAYQDVCEKYGLKPTVFKTKEEVVAEMSKQFVKK